MHMKNTFYVAVFHQPGQFFQLCRFNLTGVFSYFGGNVLKAQTFKKLFFVGTFNITLAFTLKYAVLVNLQPHTPGPVPHGGVMLLAACKMMQRKGKLAVLYHP